MFIMVTAVAFMVSLYWGNLWLNIYTDIKQQLYFLMLLFFGFVITELNVLGLIFKWLRYITLSFSILYIIYMFIVSLDILRPEEVNIFLEGSNIVKYEEISFRGQFGCFFYKSFYFFPIGIFAWWFHDKGKLSKIFSIIILTALTLTLVRGLILSAIVIALVLFFVKYFFTKTITIPKLALSFIVILVVGLIQFWIVQLLIGDKSSGDAIRQDQLTSSGQIVSSFPYQDLVFGYGFGSQNIPRPTHMEFMYIEILIKQGIIGLFFWLYLLISVTLRLLRSINIENESLVLIILSGLFLAYLESLTNPFLINSIGMSFVLISIVGSQLLSVKNKSDLNK